MDRMVKGQAAMEYLMTYGWAILVIVIVLVALLYIGVFKVNPPEVCAMPTGISCAKSYLKSGDTGYTAAGSRLDVVLVNGLQKTIVITGVACTKNQTNVLPCINTGFSATANNCTAYDSAAAGAIVPLGASVTLQLKCTDEDGNVLPITSVDTFNGRINVRYYFKDEDASNVRLLSGNVFAQAG